MPEVVDLKMSKELQEKLKEFTAIDTGETFKYTPKVYRENKIPKEHWPVFTLRAKNAFDLADAEDNSGYAEMTFDEKGNVKSRRFIPRSGAQRITTLKAGLVGWKNFRDAKGKEIPFVGEDSIKHLKVVLQIELQNAINEHANMTEEDLRGLE